MNFQEEEKKIFMKIFFRRKHEPIKVLNIQIIWK